MEQDRLLILAKNLDQLDEQDQAVLYGLLDKYVPAEAPVEPTPEVPETEEPEVEEPEAEAEAPEVEEPAEEPAVPAVPEETPAEPQPEAPIAPEQPNADVGEKLAALEQRIASFEALLQKLVVTEPVDEEDEIGQKAKGLKVQVKEEPVKQDIINKLGGYAK